MRRGIQRGVALLMAMLTVAMVAAIAATAVAEQWRRIGVEEAERHRAQTQWLLRGALDWSRLLLRQDALGSAEVDDLGEPWAVPLQDTRLSTFLTAQAGVADGAASADMTNAYLSGQLQDAQAKLNLMNMVFDPEALHAKHVERLLERLGVGAEESARLRTGLQRAYQSQATGDSPLLPQSLQDLSWLGVSPRTIATLDAYAVLLPSSSLVNINTASAAVIWAVSEGMGWSEANALVARRAQKSFRSVQEANAWLGKSWLSERFCMTRSSFFMAQGRVRMGEVALGMHAQLQRQGSNVAAVAVQSSGMVLPLPTP
ncbi:MAG: type II secretion system minor pseudopilin GspK [Comamonas sp.]